MSDIRYNEPMGGKPSAIEFYEPLADFSFPADRGRVIAYAKDHGANDRVINTLEELEDRQFQDLREIFESLDISYDV